jgi:hypothetical protein
VTDAEQIAIKGVSPMLEWFRNLPLARLDPSLVAKWDAMNAAYAKAEWLRDDLMQEIRRRYSISEVMDAMMRPDGPPPV